MLDIAALGAAHTGFAKIAKRGAPIPPSIAMLAHIRVPEAMPNDACLPCRSA